MRTSRLDVVTCSSLIAMLMMSCVEPPPAVTSTPDDMMSPAEDMPQIADALMQDSGKDMQRLSGARIVINGGVAQPVVMHAYSRHPFDVRVFDDNDELIAQPELFVSYMKERGDVLNYNPESQQLESSQAGAGVMLVRSEAANIEVKVPYETRSFSPRYRVPRVLHIPYSERLSFQDLLQVAPSGQLDYMGVNDWLSDVLEGAITYSLIETDQVGTPIKNIELDTTLSDLVPQRHDYILKLQYIAAGAAQPIIMPITIFTHEPNQITSGLAHHCKIVDQKPSCWGANNIGQLGMGDYRDRLSSSALPSPLKTFAIESILYHTCAISNEFDVHCWGNNDQGHVNRDVNPNNVNSLPTPTLQTPPQTIFNAQPFESQIDPIKFTQVQTGHSHTCALSTRGVVYCWGNDTHLQLGAGPDWTNTIVSMDTNFPPIELTGDDLDVRFSKISAGLHHTCALSFEGDLFCWGDNRRAQSQPRHINLPSVLPQRVVLSGAPRLVDVWTGPNNTCAQTEDLEVFCWGDNSNEKLFIDGTQLVSTPTKLNAFAPESSPTPVLLDLELGQNHSCALSQRGEAQFLHCWGLGTSGQLGLGDESLSAVMATNDRPRSVFNDTQAPLPIPELDSSRTLDLSLAHNTTCILDAKSGDTTCWGEQIRGSLGDNTSGIQPPPTSRDDYTTIEGYPIGFEEFEAIPSLIKPALMLKSTCLLVPDLTDNNDCDRLEPMCWGSNDHGQAGDGTISLTAPFDVLRQVDADISASPHGLAASAFQVCALKQDASRQSCWGRNRTSEEGTKLLTAENEFLLAKPVKYMQHNAHPRLAMSAFNTCSWAPDRQGLPPTCRGTQRRGSLGSAMTPSFVDTWQGLDDARDKIGVFTLENKYFDPMGSFNDDNNKESITQFELHTHVGCMVRKSEAATNGMHTYTLWCWGDIEEAWGIANTPTWGDTVSYSDTNASEADKMRWRSYLPRVLLQTKSARPPRALSLGTKFGCLVAHDGALICWGTPPLLNESLNNLRVDPTTGEASGTGDLELPFETPVQLFASHTFWDMDINRNTACLQHASTDNNVQLQAEPTLTCFGNNGSGQAGEVDASGTITQHIIRTPLQNNVLTPVELGGLSELYQFTVGEDHVCVTGQFEGITPAGALELACWGLDTHGQARASQDTLYEGIIHTAALPTSF